MKRRASPGQTFWPLTLFNFEGFSLGCTLKTEQRRRKSKATEGVARKRNVKNSIVELFNRNRPKGQFQKGKYNFVNIFC